MHRDHQLGLALGVLVVGFAGALCFSRHPDLEQRLLQLENTAEIDAEIARLPVRAYTEAETAHTPRGAANPPPAAPIVGHADPLLPGAAGAFALRAGPPDPIRPIAPPSTATPATPTAEPTAPTVQTAPAPRAAASVVEAVPAGSECEPAVSAASPASSEPRRYTVQPGDTLSGLAVRFLGRHSRYLEIFEANRELLATPDDLRPGMLLTIPQAAGEEGDSIQSAARGVDPVKEPARGGDMSGGPGAAEVSQPEQAAGTDPAPAKRRFRPAGTQPFIPGERRSEAPRRGLPALSTSALQPAPETATTYTVQRGDTLEGIALKVYGDRRALADLLAANRDQVSDPRRLLPGTVLILPGIEAAP